MYWTSLILFFLMISFLGYSISFFVKRKETILEQFLTNLGIGLGTFVVLAMILNLLKIQLHWAVFLVIGAIIPAYALYKWSKKGDTFSLTIPKKIRLKKATIYILGVLVLSIIFFGVYHHGAFKYPYLEDDDPWHHTVVATYVSEFKTFSHDPSITINYIQPYPPAYAVLMGVLHQTNHNIIWNLKFFNVLIIALANIFFYFFAREFFKDDKKAFFATFFLVSIPCFLSHFIWASSLAIALFFPALYATEKTKENKLWIIPAAIGVAGVLLTQPSNAVIFGLMYFLYWATKVITTRNTNSRIFLAGFIGLMLALLTFYLPTIAIYGVDGLRAGIGLGSTSVLHFSGAGSGGGLLYHWSDFFIAKTASKMDNPVGVGMFLFALTLLSAFFIIYKIINKPAKILSAKTTINWVMLVWLLFTFAGIHSNRLPIQLMPHRFWAIFAIPLALICAEGLMIIGKLSDKINFPRLLAYTIIIAGIIITSAYPKYVVETSYWPPGVAWGSPQELNGYLQNIPQTPVGSKIFPLCSEAFKVIALDRIAEPWNPEYKQFELTAFDKSPSEIREWLNMHNYRYLTMDTYCVRKHDQNKTIEMFNALQSSEGFKIISNTEGFFLFSVI